MKPLEMLEAALPGRSGRSELIVEALAQNSQHLTPCRDVQVAGMIVKPHRRGSLCIGEGTADPGHVPATGSLAGFA